MLAFDRFDRFVEASWRLSSTIASLPELTSTQKSQDLESSTQTPALQKLVVRGSLCSLLAPSKCSQLRSPRYRVH